MTFLVQANLSPDAGLTMEATMHQLSGFPFRKQLKARPPRAKRASTINLCSKLTALAQPLHLVISTTTVILFLLGVLCAYVQPAHQQLLCPKVCHCDEQTLETVCRVPIFASGIPYTLNPSTKRVVINHAQITVFSTLDYIKNLETLDLAYNKIAAIDFVHINSNVNLVSLNASHNNLSELKDSTVSAAISKLDSSSVNLFANSDSEESEKLKALRRAKINVIELILSHNHLITLRNFTFLRWARLQRLDLSQNSIVSLETESLSGLTKMKYLNLSGNHLIQVPGQALLGTTRSLNLISSSHEPWISPLRSLDLSENALVSLDPSSFNALGQLQELYLDSCSLQSIDERALRELTNLNVLSMNHNNFIEVPTDSFSTLSSLKQLFLDSNYIQQLHPYAFRNLLNLEELHINNGSLRELQAQALAGLISLRHLSLAHNTNLNRVYDSLLEDLPKLVHLDFYMCSLSSLPAENGLDGHPLAILDLRENSLRCDCQLKWLTKWLTQTNKTVTKYADQGKMPSYSESVKDQVIGSKMANEQLNITCAGPPALAGKPVIDLPDIKLECIRPTSSLNVHVGFASLLLMTLLLIIACMVNFCRDEGHFIGIIKENLVKNRIVTVLPYSQDLHKNVDNFKKGTQMECAEYEPVDYGQAYGPIYTVPQDQYVLDSSTSQQQTHQM